MSDDLITPLSLASDPVRIDFPDISYDHKKQTCDFPRNDKLYGRTWNQTRTWDYKGNPKDSDND